MNKNLKKQIEILSEIELDKVTIKKLKSILGDDFQIDTKIEKERFKEKIELVSAQKLDESILQKVKSKFGDNKEYIEVLDPSVIGGIMIRTREKLFDGTIKGQLNKLKNNL